MRVTWLGHSGVLLEADGLRVAADPLLRARVGPLRRSGPVVAAGPVDVVLLSHLHHDHCDLPSLRALRAPVVVAPPGAGAFLTARGIAGVVELDVGARLRLPSSVTVTAVPADHSGRREPRGPRAVAVGHVVESAGSSVWLAGDTGLFDGMSELASSTLRGVLDLAMVPVWGWGPNLGPGHLDPAQAAVAVARAGARLAVPVHWGTLHPAGLRRLMRDRLRTPGPEFAARCPVARLLSPGDSLVL